MNKKRTNSGMSLGAASANPAVSTETREGNAHGITRENRIGMGGASKTLSIPIEVQKRLEKEGKHLHFVLDNDKGQLQKAINAGYEHVVDEGGNNIYRNAGGRNQYLMAIPNKWHEEDKLLKRKRAAANMGKADDESSSINLDGAVSSTESDNPYTTS